MSTQTRTNGQTSGTKAKTNGSASASQGTLAELNGDSDRAPDSGTMQAARDGAAEVADRVRAGARHVQDVAHAGQQHAASFGQSLQVQVRDNPLLAVGTAFGLGIAVALLLSSRD